MVLLTYFLLACLLACLLARHYGCVAVCVAGALPRAVGARELGDRRLMRPLAFDGSRRTPGCNGSRRSSIELPGINWRRN